MLRGLGASVSRPRRRFFSFLSFDLFRDSDTVHTFQGRPKEHKLDDIQLAELRARGRTPFVVMGRIPTMRDNPKNMHGSIATRCIMREFKKGHIHSKVFEITLPGRTPIMATVGHYYHEGTINSPMFVLFNEFVPGRRTKVTLPVRVLNTMESAAIRKGADFRYGVSKIPMYWRGNHRIPRGIILDVEHATPDLDFRLAQDAGVLPEGLSMRFPRRIYTLGTLHTTRQYEGLAEEVDAEAVAEAAQAEADSAAIKAKAAAAKAAPAKGAAKEGDAKASEPKVDGGAKKK